MRQQKPASSTAVSRISWSSSSRCFVLWMRRLSEERVIPTSFAVDATIPRYFLSALIMSLSKTIICPQNGFTLWNRKYSCKEIEAEFDAEIERQSNLTDT